MQKSLVLPENELKNAKHKKNVNEKHRKYKKIESSRSEAEKFATTHNKWTKIANNEFGQSESSKKKEVNLHAMWME